MVAVGCLLAACAALNIGHPLRTPARSPQICAASTTDAFSDERQLAALVEQWELADKNKLAAEQAALLLRADVDVEHADHAATTPATLATDEAEPHAPARLRRARALLRRVVTDGADGADDGVGAGVPLPTVPYDPAAAAARFASTPLAVGMRQMQLVAPLVRFLAKVVLDVQRGAEEENRKARAAELADLVGRMGPAIIKAGQALSSRSDLLPSEYLRELQRLQDDVPPFADADAYEIVASELGRPMEEVYELVSATPVAAASLGQVYRARLKEDGEGYRAGDEVALKVQRPGCEETIALDLYILRAYSATLKKLLGLLGRDIDLVSVIDDFGRLIYAEIDYSVEASNGARFRNLYGTIANVSAPAVYPSLSTRRLLTMEWVDGTRLNDVDALTAKGLQPSALVDTLVQCSLRQMLGTGFFHADPHAGNLLVTDDGVLTYLDFGMMSFLEPAQRYAIIEAVVHMVNRDFTALSDLYGRMGFIPPDEDTAPIAAALNDALPDVLNASVAELNFKSVINKLGDVMYKYPFSLPPFYIAVIRCLGVLEGVAMEVDNSFAIVKDAYPYIASRLLTDKAPQLQAALLQLLFPNGALKWEYLEGLLENAAATDAYEPLLAVERIADHLLSPEGAPCRRRSPMPSSMSSTL